MPAAFLPKAIEAASVENQADVIEVIGTRAQESEKIDRRTYQVQQTPHSAQKDAVQLLRGLPAITVTPDDRILLLGAGNANIYINGRPYIGDAKQYLRTLHGTDIDRIEVLTNPSAQFSAEGTGGVINVILRKNETAGTSGNVSLQSSSYGHSLVDTTVNVKRGKWAYEVKAGGNVGTMARSRYQKLRTVEGPGGDLANVNSEDGEFSYEGVVGRLSGKVTYDLDPKTTISAQLGGGGGHDIVTNKGQFLGLTANFPSFYEHRIMSSVASYLMGEFSILHRGTAKGETLSASAQFYANPDVRDMTDARFSDGRLFRTDVHKPSQSVDAHIDWKRPTAAGQILSIGSTWRLDGTTQDYRFTSIGAGSTLGPDVTDAYDGSSSTTAAYVTFQQPLGALILTPGLRVEHNARRISSPGSAELVIRRSDLFPTFHAKQRLGRKLDLSASYSKRIERARLEILRPYGLVEDAVTVFQGSPNLKDQSTHSYEVSLHYHSGKTQAGIIAYMRDTDDVWSRTYTVSPAGTTVYSFVNAGSRRNAGAQFDLSTALNRRLKVSASLNLFNQRNPVDAFGRPEVRSDFRYTTNGTLEWTLPERGSVPGDVAQLQWSYNSRSRDYQLTDLAWWDASLAYTHSISRTLSLSATFRSPRRTRQRLIAPFAQEAISRQRTPEFQLKLLKTLGGR
ncbi:TonB-dependent receptor [Novosphingobium sp. JCM 18896]|uniref:TonB-dependent receptor n=1 Tax=Novosphingobium sp. JCM 18896 TaxID=2989731 RepID=UPI002222B552|nr:TonB-dependent receptor [Novosphingobium sp. JCM 18896]MCW1431589.1 TonB-dependent receptor [Novosphingobium sp. JCM 18896]